MSTMKPVVVLLMVAAIGANGELGTNNCGNLSATVSPTDQKILGDWVLVKSFSKSSGFDWILADISSSHVELRLLPDSDILMYTERNMNHNKSCATYFMNMTMPSASDNHTLQVISRALLTVHGVVIGLNRRATVTFYEALPDFLTLVLRGELSDFVRFYRREGHHQDTEPMKAIHSDHQKLAECLGVRHDNHFKYDKTADICHRKSSP